jgi:hypothetical protein
MQNQKKKTSEALYYWNHVSTTMEKSWLVDANTQRSQWQEEKTSQQGIDINKSFLFHHAR